MLHRTFAQALGCASDEEYGLKRNAIIAYLKISRPEYFRLEDGRRRSFEQMARVERIEVDEKLEDFALLEYLVRRSFLETAPEEALSIISMSTLSPADKDLVRKIVLDLFNPDV